MLHKYLYEVKSLLTFIFIKNHILSDKTYLGSNTTTILDSPFHYKLVKTNIFRPIYKISLVSSAQLPISLPGVLIKKNLVFRKRLFITFV